MFGGCASNQHTTIAPSPSGHYVQHAGQTLMLVGDSGTQCVMQNANLNYREWIDDCASRKIPLAHIWSFVPPRQKQDGSQIEERWGYVYPGLTPWRRMSAGPLAMDQLPQWDLRNFDDGADNQLDSYWPRLRDLCGYAKEKGMLVGITVFTGWAKHKEDWAFHPLNRQNGGHLDNVADAVVIESPGVEVWEQEWSDSWPNPRKTQWIWERLAHEYINQLNPLGNVFFIFLDEHSYSEGNMGDHFCRFFKTRGAVWMDWDQRRQDVDFVYSDTISREDKNPTALAGFLAQPARPYFLLEGDPYQGDAARMSMWSFAMGGGHYTFHADERQETTRTGIMGYDPHVPGGDKGMDKRNWLGHLSHFFNECVNDLDSMAPHNELTDAEAYCLAFPGIEYVVYSKCDAPTTFQVDLSHAVGKDLIGRFYNPRNGTYGDVVAVKGGAVETFTKPDTNDYVLHIFLESGSRDLLTQYIPVNFSCRKNAWHAPGYNWQYRACH